VQNRVAIRIDLLIPPYDDFFLTVIISKFDTTPKDAVRTFRIGHGPMSIWALGRLIVHSGALRSCLLHGRVLVLNTFLIA